MAKKIVKAVKKVAKKAVKKVVKKSVKKEVVKIVPVTCQSCGGRGLQDQYHLCSACHGNGTV